ncbi:MAG: GNAT family N-acetyltransferase [Hyphomicrobiaceae bacterium]
MDPSLNVRIVKLADLAPSERPVADITRIFFEASTTRNFVDAGSREDFRERWLGRYLTHDLEHAFVALTPTGEAVGYLVGALEDPAKTDRFGDIGYFATIGPLTARYPAHLHMNCDAAWRSKGIGTELIDRFRSHAIALGSPGVHVVTGFGVRNVGFYLRNGFRETARFEWVGRPLVMLSAALRTTP